MKKIIEWKFVHKDGLPEPNRNKVYVITHPNGYGFGTYEKSYEKTLNRWYLDFDSTGCGDDITAYFEIPWYDEE